MDPFDDYPPQPDWSRAACANTGAGGDEFFADHRGAQYTYAKRVCAACPIDVRTTCLQWATAHDEQGYWAGTTQPQRRTLAREDAAA